MSIQVLFLHHSYVEIRLDRGTVFRGTGFAVGLVDFLSVCFRRPFVGLFL